MNFDNEWLGLHFGRFFKKSSGHPGPIPTTSIYNASAVKTYNATSSLAGFES
jgi:hypothetical protein